MRAWLLLLVVMAAPGWAADVYVNGINVEGLANQQFDKVNVKLDEKGNVHIDAPGYAVKRVAVPPAKGEATAREEGIITRKYFLVTERTGGGVAEYDVEIFINGTFLRTVRSADEQLVTDVSRQLKPGKNTVVFQAKKALVHPDDGPQSTSKANVFRVIVGEGKMTEDQVIIEKPLITFTRTAAEQNDVAQEFALTTR
ncbi:MAG: hypothetical protein JNG84_14325 [Archangium sp.]|nr:hypothetical protein [Archangium sp.]